MNILFVHEVDWLAKVVFDIHFLAEGISLLGHQVFVIDYEDDWKRDSFFDLGRLGTAEIQGTPRAFAGALVNLRRPGFIKIPGLSRLSAVFTHRREIRQTIREKNIDAVVLYSVPTNGLQTINAARKFGIPVVFRSIDILNMLVPYPALRPVTRLLEKKVYNGVDAILPNTPQYLKYVTGMGINGTKVRLLPFPVDTGLFHPSIDSSEVRQKWGLGEGDKVVVFIGTLFEFSGLNEFITRFPQVIKDVPEAKLLIVGDGPQRPRLESMIKELGLERQVVITGFQPYETMPQYINLATVCINTFLIREAMMDVFPAKIMQYVACGKATVATALRGIMTILPGESHGVVYVNDFDSMTGEVISLLKSVERRQSLERAGQDYIKSTHDYQKISRELESVLEEAIDKKRHGTAKRT